MQKHRSQKNQQFERLLKAYHNDIQSPHRTRIFNRSNGSVSKQLEQRPQRKRQKPLYLKDFCGENYT
ncbi:hypothetical protein GJ496_006145 [Pomphorhynchus laevis]|nr:hypothetical protein GJ496_006145 [Pomphorhynchus laevis]